MQDDCTTNSHYPQLYSSLYKVGRMQFLSLGVKGLNCITHILPPWSFHNIQLDMAIRPPLLLPCDWLARHLASCCSGRGGCSSRRIFFSLKGEFCEYLATLDVESSCLSSSAKTRRCLYLPQLGRRRELPSPKQHLSDLGALKIAIG